MLRSLAFASLIAATGSAAHGCAAKGTDETGSEAASGSGAQSLRVSTGSFSVTWTLSGAVTACGRGWFVDLDLRNQATMADYHDSFQCSDLRGGTMAFPIGTYASAARLRDATGALLSESALGGPHELSAGSQKDLGHIVFEVSGPATADQQIELTWDIRGCTNADCTSVLPMPIACAESAAEWVVLTVDRSEYRFACSDGGGVTPSIEAGMHDVSVELEDWWGLTLSRLPAEAVEVLYGAPLKLPVQFIVSAP